MKTSIDVTGVNGLNIQINFEGNLEEIREIIASHKSDLEGFVVFMRGNSSRMNDDLIQAAKAWKEFANNNN